MGLLSSTFLSEKNLILLQYYKNYMNISTITNKANWRQGSETIRSLKPHTPFKWNWKIVILFTYYFLHRFKSNLKNNYSWIIIKQLHIHWGMIHCTMIVRKLLINAQISLCDLYSLWDNNKLIFITVFKLS